MQWRSVRIDQRRDGGRAGQRGELHAGRDGEGVGDDDERMPRWMDVQDGGLAVAAKVRVDALRAAVAGPGDGGHAASGAARGYVLGGGDGGAEEGVDFGGEQEVQRGDDQRGVAGRSVDGGGQLGLDDGREFLNEVGEVNWRKTRNGGVEKGSDHGQMDSFTWGGRGRRRWMRGRRIK